MRKERCSGSYCQAVGFLVIKDAGVQNVSYKESMPAE
jgi:hypothetical protein